MAELKLSKLPDRTPVNLSIVITPDLHRALCDYAEANRDTYGESEAVPTSCRSCCDPSSTPTAGLQKPVPRRRRGESMVATLQRRSDLLPQAKSGPVLCVRADGSMRMLGIGKTKLYELIATGELETIRIGRQTLVLRASIEQFVERLREKNSMSEDRLRDAAARVRGSHAAGAQLGADLRSR